MRKSAFVAIATFLIALNLWSFASALPETRVVDSGCCTTNALLAKDFSAYYTGAWRLLHDPAQIYARGSVADGGPTIFPQPESYKYLPSFLLMIMPLLALPYQNALTAFDAAQFILVPLIAFLVYELTKDKSWGATLLVAVLVLIMPYPYVSSGWGISASYYWQWAEGQSKVLETFLLLSALYLGERGKPVASGAVFALASFDPRFTLLGLPLFILGNKRLLTAILSGVVTLAVTNCILLIPSTGTAFLRMIVGNGLTTPLYPYSLIPLAALLSLMLVRARDLGNAFRAWRDRLRPSRFGIANQRTPKAVGIDRDQPPSLRPEQATV